MLMTTSPVARKEGASDRTVYKELVALRVSLKLARRAQRWHGSPEAVLPVGFKSDYKPRNRFLSPEELEKLLRELIPEHAARVAFIVATSANWRESELARREDVSEDFCTVLLRGTKTKTRFRTIPIVLPLHRSLLEHPFRYAEEDGNNDKDVSPRTGKLFAPWHNVNRDLVAACKRAGVPRCSPNDLRRTSATWLRASGLPPHLIAPVLGHVDSTMAEKVYARLTPEMLRGQMLAHLGPVSCSAGAANLQQIAALNAPIARFQAANALKSARPEGVEPPTFGFEEREH
jgi:integrase